MSVIALNGITKDYGGNKGVFDVSFTVEKGEVFGFLGPNGAGKTTTIRQLMGFIRPDGGTARINGMDCFEQSHLIKRTLGFLPGEIAVPEEMKGGEFLRFMARMLGMREQSRMKELLDFFELNPSGRVKKMSKGMKQKLGIVCAFMHRPDILILDEPTSGLDPLMQNRFIELILREKERGATILMSSHIFEEVERTCDRAAIIKEGRIVAVENMEKLQKSRKKLFEVRFSTPELARRFGSECPDGEQSGKTVRAYVRGADAFIKRLVEYTIEDISIRPQTLEELFLHFYGEGK